MSGHLAIDVLAAGALARHSLATIGVVDHGVELDGLSVDKIDVHDGFRIHVERGHIAHVDGVHRIILGDGAINHRSEPRRGVCARCDVLLLRGRFHVRRDFAAKSTAAGAGGGYCGAALGVFHVGVGHYHDTAREHHDSRVGLVVFLLADVVQQVLDRSHYTLFAVSVGVHIGLEYAVVAVTPVGGSLNAVGGEFEAPQAELVEFLLGVLVTVAVELSVGVEVATASDGGQSGGSHRINLLAALFSASLPDLPDLVKMGVIANWDF